MLSIWQRDKFQGMGYDMGTLNHRELLIETIEKYFPFESILDVGCATGADLALIQMVMPTTKRSGFDLSPENIKEAKEKGVQADIKEGDLRDLLQDMKTDSVDVVFSNGVIMYVDVDYIKEMVRVARKAVILSERDPNTKIAQKLDEIGKPWRLTEVTHGIRDSWGKDGFIYEIMV